MAILIIMLWLLEFWLALAFLSVMQERMERVDAMAEDVSRAAE